MTLFFSFSNLKSVYVFVNDGCGGEWRAEKPGAIWKAMELPVDLNVEDPEARLVSWMWICCQEAGRACFVPNWCTLICILEKTIKNKKDDGIGESLVFLHKPLKTEAVLSILDSLYNPGFDPRFWFYLQRSPSSLLRPEKVDRGRRGPENGSQPWPSVHYEVSFSLWLKTNLETFDQYSPNLCNVILQTLQPNADSAGGQEYLQSRAKMADEQREMAWDNSSHQALPHYLLVSTG